MNNKEESEEKFKKITEAYEVLSDKKKRQEYDLYGEAGQNARFSNGQNPQQGFPEGFQQFYQPGNGNSGFTFKFGGPGGFSGFPGQDSGGLGDMFQDIMGQFFGGAGGFGQSDPFQQQQQQQRTSRSKNRSPFESMNSQYPSKRPRDSTGTTGKKNSRQATSDHETVTVRVDCTLEELFTGKTKNLKVSDSIETRDGNTKPIQKTFAVSITPGQKKGAKISFPATPDFPKKVIFEVYELPHTIYQRAGDNLIWTSTLKKRQIEKGVLVKVPLIDGKEFIIDTKEYTIRDGTQVPLKGRGMPSSSGSSAKSQRGDLIVKFKITN